MESPTLAIIDDALTERVKERILEACRPRAIYLFGSAARGEAGEESDLDLLVVMEPEDGMTARQQARRLRKLFSGWKLPMDLIVLAPEEYLRQVRLPGFIARTAKREGILLYGHNELTMLAMPEPNKEEGARAWFDKADSDLRAARLLADVEPPEPDLVAFHSQQAAEKYLKGYLAGQGVDPPRTHALEPLLDLCLEFDDRFGALYGAAAFFEHLAVEPRYPLKDISVEEADEAVKQAEEVVAAVREAM